MVSARYCYGIATVLLRQCYGSATVVLPCWCHQHGSNTGEIPERYRGDTVPAGLGVCWGRPVDSQFWERHSPPPPSQVIGLASSFSPRSAWRSRRAGAGQQPVFIGGGARKGRIHAPKLEKPAG